MFQKFFYFRNRLYKTRYDEHAHAYIHTRRSEHNAYIFSRNTRLDDCQNTTLGSTVLPVWSAHKTRIVSKSFAEFRIGIDYTRVSGRETRPPVRRRVRFIRLRSKTVPYEYRFCRELDTKCPRPVRVRAASKKSVRFSDTFGNRTALSSVREIARIYNRSFMWFYQIEESD